MDISDKIAIAAVVISILTAIFSGFLTWRANKISNEANDKSNIANVLSKQANTLTTNVEFKNYYLKIFTIKDQLNKIENLLEYEDNFKLRDLCNTLVQAIKSIGKDEVLFSDLDTFEELIDNLNNLEIEIYNYDFAMRSKIIKNEQNFDLEAMGYGESENIHDIGKKIREIKNESLILVESILDIFN